MILSLSVPGVNLRGQALPEDLGELSAEDIEALVTWDQTRSTQSFAEPHFGLFDSENVMLNGEDLNSSTGIGGITSLFLEIGDLNNWAIGARQDFRIYPNTYRERCLKISNTSVYLRLKLFSMK